MPRPRRNPFFPRPTQRPSPIRLVTPTTVGGLGACALLAKPDLLLSPVADLLEGTPVPAGPLMDLLERVPPRAYAALGGFAIGYGMTKCFHWARLRALKALFSYQDWIYGGKTLKDKAWVILLRMLKGPGPFSTFEFQHVLPSQPLPALDDTLDLWLSVASQLVSKEEFRMTEEAVQRFRTHEGPKLQKYLQERAATTVNWLSEYWVKAAYLSNRDPLAICSNFYCYNVMLPESSTDQWARAATQIYGATKFREGIMAQELLPIQLQNLVPLCMNGYGYIFNSVRVPGENIDTLQRYPTDTHIVVIRGGHYFRLELYATSPSGRRTILTPEEIKHQLCRIRDEADALGDHLPVAALTAQKRAIWAKHRELLMAKNSDVLRAVESSMFVVCIDDSVAKDENVKANWMLCGRGSDRWFDKGFTCVYLEDGTVGYSVEHSVIDALVMGSVVEYTHVAAEFDKDGDVIKDGKHPPRDLSAPKRLEWDLKYMEPEITSAAEFHKKQREDLDVHILHAPYGKGFMKTQHLSPDGYMQMAIQLAYYRMHNETVKTYEPATARMYALGRTESIQPLSTYSKAWLNAMGDDSATRQTRETLLKKAINEQNNFRLRSTVGKGCDRHLLGLYCASREMGMDMPAVFMDKAWRLPYKLSTSQTPARLHELGAEVDLQQSAGGFGPSCHDGYGVSYVPHGDDIFTLSITSWKSCEETDSTRFADTLRQVMNDMKTMLVD